MSREHTTLITVFCILFVNGLGLGLLFPVLDTLLLDVHKGFLTDITNESILVDLYGLTVGIFMLAWFIGAFVLSAWSDTVGRKKALVTCLLGSFIGFVITSIAIYTLSFTLLIIGRVINGFTAGSQPISQAIAIDLSNDRNRPYYLGFVILAIMLGITGGPIIADILSEPSIVSWFDYRMPFYFAAIFSLVNVGLITKFLQETRDTPQTRKHSIGAIGHLKEVLLDSKIKKYCLVLFFLITGWSAYFSYIGLYLINLYQFTDLQNSGFLSFFALGCTIGGCFLVKYFGTRYTLDKVTIIGSMLCAISVFLTIVIMPVWYMMLMAVILGMSLCLSYTVIMAIISFHTGEHQQGSLMGITGSIMALCFGLSDMVNGYLASFHWQSPLYFSAFTFLLAALVFYFFIPNSLNKNS